MRTIGSIDKKTRLQILECINQIACKNNACLVSTKYINRDSPLIFNCLRCGNQFFDKWSRIRYRRNEKLKCPNCNPQKIIEDYYSELKSFVESKLLSRNSNYCS